MYKYIFSINVKINKVNRIRALEYSSPARYIVNYILPERVYD